MQYSFTAAVVCALLSGIATIAVASTVSVTISDLAFTPADIDAKVGDTVEWTNRDYVDHTATSTDGAWDTDVAAGQSGKVILTRPGTFGYFCKVHPNMTGTVHVAPK